MNLNPCVDVFDRTIRKIIERLNGFIKGYKAVSSGVSATDEFEALFLKLRFHDLLTVLQNQLRVL